MGFTRLGPFLVVALMLGACGSSSDAGTPAQDSASHDQIVSASSTVAVNVFSGRPNPSFELSEVNAAIVDRLLDEVLASEPVDQGAAPGDLGLRGFLLGETGGDEVVVVGPDGVRARGAVFSDPDQSLFSELRRLAIANDPDLAELIASE